MSRGSYPAGRSRCGGCAEHAETSAGLAARRGVSGTDRRTDPPPGRADRPRRRSGAPARGRGELMLPEATGSPGVPGDGRAAGGAIRRWPPAGGRDARPARVVRRPARAPAVAHRGTPARRPDRPPRQPRRRLPRGARDARGRSARQHQRVRGGRFAADPHQEPGDAAAAAGDADRPGRGRRGPGSRGGAACAPAALPRPPRRWPPSRGGRARADRPVPARGGCGSRFRTRRRATGRRPADRSGGARRRPRRISH